MNGIASCKVFIDTPSEIFRLWPLWMSSRSPLWMAHCSIGFNQLPEVLRYLRRPSFRDRLKRLLLGEAWAGWVWACVECYCVVCLWLTPFLHFIHLVLYYWRNVTRVRKSHCIVDVPMNIWMNEWGHSTSPTVFLPITWDPNEIETWDWCHCVCLRKAHRMMYNWTYLDHRVTLPWLDLRSDFDIDLWRSDYTWFDAPCRDKHNRSQSLFHLLKQRHRRRTILVKFDLLTSGDLNFDLSLKMTQVVSECFFPSFRTPFFRFVLRCAGAEIDGGVQTPPHQVVENPEAHQSAG